MQYLIPRTNVLNLNIVENLWLIDLGYLALWHVNKKFKNTLVFIPLIFLFFIISVCSIKKSTKKMRWK
jgi:hypothetical protein